MTGSRLLDIPPDNFELFSFFLLDCSWKLCEDDLWKKVSYVAAADLPVIPRYFVMAILLFLPKLQKVIFQTIFSWDQRGQTLHPVWGPRSPLHQGMSLFLHPPDVNIVLFQVREPWQTQTHWTKGLGKNCLVIIIWKMYKLLKCSLNRNSAKEI